MNELDDNNDDDEEEEKVQIRDAKQVLKKVKIAVKFSKEALKSIAKKQPVEMTEAFKKELVVQRNREELVRNVNHFDK